MYHCIDGVWQYGSRLNITDPNAIEIGDVTAIDGDCVAVSNSYDPAYSMGSAVTLYHREGDAWYDVASYPVPSNPDGTEGFDSNVAMGGGVMVIAHPSYNHRKGQVTVYRLGADGYALETTLETDTAGRPSWGFSLAVSGDGSRILVGSYEKSQPDQPVAVYDYDTQTQTWGLTQTLASECKLAYPVNVALSHKGTVAAIGCPMYGEGSLQYSGRVQMYAQDEISSNLTWFQDLTGRPWPNDNVGYSMAFNGDADGRLFATGAPEMSGLFVYERDMDDGMYYMATSESTDPTQADTYLGVSVTITGDTLLSGMPRPAIDAGAVAVFDLGLLN
ncbi:hypothetical protein KIPB_005156 [Kipferlia bialata]|uniref:Uncharacterized protein n=1 Tax=Kipferlia bialata TaxID=797122 RepID=A0A9K3CUY3_9EUKA|nr:hypothetical protein KIPB_005156 [Kipferlia bialata]|eukprot:g5156.t1